MTDAAVSEAPEPSPYLPSAATFLVAGLLVACAAFAYAQLAYLTVLECDRAADACVMSESKPWWKDEIDRFPASKVREAKHFEREYKGRISNCVALTVSSRLGPVEFCGSASAGFAAGVSAFLADPGRPGLVVALDNSFNGRAIALVLLGAAAFPALFGLWLWPRARRPR